MFAVAGLARAKDADNSAPLRTSGAPDRSSVCVDADDELAERVLRAILQTGYGTLRHVRITAEGGTVRLNGQVSSYYFKQLAQQKAMSVDGVRRITNQLQVS